MVDLISILPLGGTSPRVARIGAITLSEGAGFSLVTLSPGSRLPHPFGISLPDPGRMATPEAMAVWCSGSREWMCLARDGRDLAADLAHKAEGCAITDQSDAWAMFGIDAGERADAVLERLVNLDLQVLTSGAAVVTRIAQLRAILLREDGGVLTLLSPRPAAGTMWDFLEKTLRQLT